MAVGQGRLAEHGKHLQGPTSPVSSFTGRLDEKRFEVEDMKDAVSGALSTQWDEVYKEISPDDPFWEKRADNLKAYHNRLGGQNQVAVSFAKEAQATYPLHALLVSFLPTITNLRYTHRDRALFEWLSLPARHQGFKHILETRPIRRSDGSPAEVYLADYYDFVEQDLVEEAPDHVTAYHKSFDLAQNELERMILKTIVLLTIPVPKGLTLETSAETIAIALNTTKAEAQKALTRLEEVEAVQRDRGQYFLPDSGSGVSSTTLQNEMDKVRKAEWEEPSGSLKPVSGDVLCEILAKFSQYLTEFHKLDPGAGVTLLAALPATKWSPP